MPKHQNCQVLSVTILQTCYFGCFKPYSELGFSTRSGFLPRAATAVTSLNEFSYVILKLLNVFDVIFVLNIGKKVIFRGFGAILVKLVFEDLLQFCKVTTSEIRKKLKIGQGIISIHYIKCFKDILSA